MYMHTHCRIENSTSIPTTLYEFPNGYNINLTIEKYKLCESLFDSSTLKGVSGGNLLSIPSVAINSAAMCDVDIRPVGVLQNWIISLEWECIDGYVNVMSHAGAVQQCCGGWWEFFTEWIHR